MNVVILRLASLSQDCFFLREKTKSLLAQTEIQKVDRPTLSRIKNSGLPSVSLICPRDREQSSLSADTLLYACFSLDVNPLKYTPGDKHRGLSI